MPASTVAGQAHVRGPVAVRRPDRGRRTPRPAAAAPCRPWTAGPPDGHQLVGQRGRPEPVEDRAAGRRGGEHPLDRVLDLRHVPWKSNSTAGPAGAGQPASDDASAGHAEHHTQPPRTDGTRTRGRIAFWYDEPRRAVRGGPPPRSPAQEPRAGSLASSRTRCHSNWIRSSTRRARRWSRAAECSCAPRPARARRSSASSPCTWRWRRAASASTPPRSRRCPTRSSTTSSTCTGPTRSACSPATTPSTATPRSW